MSDNVASGAAVSDKPPLVWHCPFGLLSDNGIERARDEGLVVIEPFDRNSLGPNSYDVRLGEWFYREQKPIGATNVFNLFDPQHVKNVWGSVQRGIRYEKVKDRFPDLVGFKPTDLVILLGPGETILAHTEEFIGGRVDSAGHGVVPYLHARSSLARSLVGTHKCAGAGDAGYFNRFTLEVTSFSKEHWIPLQVGMRVAQASFHMVENVRQDYSERGAYQQSSDLKVVIESWRPDQMLPKLNPERP